MPSDQPKPTRGGARPGSGRKRMTDDERKAAIAQRRSLLVNKTITFTIDEFDAVRDAATAAGSTPHKWMLQAILSMVKSKDY